MVQLLAFIFKMIGKLTPEKYGFCQTWPVQTWMQHVFIGWKVVITICSGLQESND